jgi:catechol 2,3-dioxygenase-like lactoylglutathione lyase family enzyme
MASRPIDPRIQLGPALVEVADVGRSAEFYRDMLGFEITHRVGNSAVLTADGRLPLIYLTGRPEGPRLPLTVRIALRFPDRGALDEALRRLTESGVSPEGPVDDGVSEGMFVLDPDRNRIELSVVRPPDAWSFAPEAARQAVDNGTGSAIQAQPPHPSDDRGGLTALSEATRARLGEMRQRLLNLHKVLLDDAKTAYELDRGRVTSTANLLQLVINDSWFAWLHPLSELVVRIDEALQPDAPATELDGTVLLEQVERLISPGGSVEGFAQRYYEALQRQPAVIVAHAEVRRILKQAR